VLEIVAGRIIAPYVGVTIYSWTAIIGVILAGLSLGNWIGGMLVDKNFSGKTVGVVLALSGIFCLASLYILSFVAPILQNSTLDLVSASFLYVLSIFFIPAILLGIPTPMLTTMALMLDKRLGKIIGRMHALAALGSIIGTFLAGFVLIQYVGSRNIIIVAAIALLLLALPFLIKALKIIMLFIIGIIMLIVAAHSRNSFANPCEYESSYFCLRTIDASHMVPFGNAKALILDHLMHGVNHQDDPLFIASPYVQMMDELITRHFQNKNELQYYFVGGGAYTHPRLVQAKNPHNSITVAELDPLVTTVAQQHMYVDTKEMSILHMDARNALYSLHDSKFDAIVADAFFDIAIPYHLTTKEFIDLVRKRMTKDGIFTMNIVDLFPDPLMVKTMVKTLQTVFKYVEVWADDLPSSTQRMTFILTASDVKNIHNNTITTNNLHMWYNITQPLHTTGTHMSTLPVFSDDFVPVEKMINNLLLTEKH
jgi:spermidine synthase